MLEPNLSLGPSPGSTFVRIPPGKSYEVESEPFIPVKRVATKLPGLDAGKYVVQIEVETWPETQEVGRILANRWRKWGDLWTEPTLLSRPLRIEVSARPEVQSCQ